VILMVGNGERVAMVAQYLLLFALSFAICAAVVVTRRHHGGLTLRRADHLAPQSAHLDPTPRIGGVGLVAAIAVFLVFMPEGRLAFQAGLFTLTLLPVFLFGLAEDLGWPVSPRLRLMAAAVSSLLVVALLGVWITHADIPGLDRALTLAPVAIAFTLFWVTGLCHATNLVDGVNGLSSGIGAMIALGLGVSALKADDPALAVAAFAMVPAILGFFVLNWPWGLIFLGDAGAYTLGHVLGWLGIILVARNPEAAGIAVGLMFFWPVADTLFAMWRRRRAGRPTGAPDRLHFHQLVMRTLEIAFGIRHRRRLTNPLTTVVILPMAAMPVLAGVALWDRPGAALWALAGFWVLYLGGYEAVLRLCRTAPERRRARKDRPRPGVASLRRRKVDAA